MTPIGTAEETRAVPHPDGVEALRDAFPASALRSSPESIAPLLKDQSWLSPVLARDRDRRREEQGPALGVEAVLSVESEEDVRQVAAIAARHRMPIIPRGAGTSNFGLVTPDHGGVLLDMRALSGRPEVADDLVRAPAGTIQRELEQIARQEGQELPLLTTTYATATAGGWVTGGHVGLGSSYYGTVWDDIVRELRVVTVEETPRTLTLTSQEEIHPYLHTFGTVGIVTEVALRTAPARDWVEAVAFFPDFDRASEFTIELSGDTRYHHRVVAAQEEALMPTFKPLAEVLRPGPGVLMLVDRDQLEDVSAVARSHGGHFVEWQPWQLSQPQKAAIAMMVYGHRMLWVKRLFPDAAFFHVYFDPDDPMAGVRLLKERYGDDLLIELKFIRSGWMRQVLGHPEEGTLPAAVISLRDGSKPGRVEELLRVFDQAGLRFQNSHTNVIEDNGMAGDIAPIVAAKASSDPHALLNPGRLRGAVRRP